MGEDGRAREVRGTARRLTKVLRAFARHPSGTEAVALADALSPRGPDLSAVAAARAWAAAALGRVSGRGGGQVARTLGGL